MVGIADLRSIELLFSPQASPARIATLRAELRRLLVDLTVGHWRRALGVRTFTKRLLFRPATRTRAMLCITLRMRCQQTDAAFHGVFMFFDVVLTPAAYVVVDHWARPIAAMMLVVPWVEIQVAVATMLGDDPGHGAKAECRSRRSYQCLHSS